METSKNGKEQCIFCSIGGDHVMWENERWVVRMDEYPVSVGHALIIPKKHYETFFDLPQAMMEELPSITCMVKEALDESFHPNGYNVGFNCGIAAGQSIPHFHLHVIPRYEGDVENPRGGIRGVIPSKQNY